MDHLSIHVRTVAVVALAVALLALLFALLALRNVL